MHNVDNILDTLIIIVKNPSLLQITSSNKNTQSFNRLCLFVADCVLILQCHFVNSVEDVLLF